MKVYVFAFLFLCVATVSYAAGDNLSEMFKETGEIKVYLKDVKIDISDPDAKEEVFREVFGDVLKKRINIEFVQARSEKDSNVVVLATISKYTYNEKVLPSFWSTAAIIADTTAPKSAAKLSVDYRILDPQTGKTLLSFKNFTTDTRRPQKDMTKDKAFFYAAQKNINRFFYRAFYKQQKKRGVIH